MENKIEVLNPIPVLTGIEQELVEFVNTNLEVFKTTAKKSKHDGLVMIFFGYNGVNNRLTYDKTLDKCVKIQYPLQAGKNLMDGGIDGNSVLTDKVEWKTIEL